jgi:PAS domain S-box-containing protein
MDTESGRLAWVGEDADERFLNCAPDKVPTICQLLIISAPELNALNSLSERHRNAHVAAWAPDADDARVDEILDLGFDVVLRRKPELNALIRAQRRYSRSIDTIIAQFESHDALLSFCAEIAARPTLKDVLRIAVGRLADLFDFDRTSVMLLNESQEIAHVVMENEDDRLDNMVLRLEDYPELLELVRTREPLFIPDVLGESLMQGVRGKLQQADHKTRTSVLFPLICRGEVAGALFLRSTRQHENVEERMMIVGKTIAAVTSAAISYGLEQDVLLSQRKQLEMQTERIDQELEQVKHFSDLFEQSRDGIIVTDTDGDIQYVNPAAANILRMPALSLINESFLVLLTAESQTAARKAYEGLGLDPLGYVDLGLIIEGDLFIVLSAAIRPLKEGSAGVLVSFREVTELRLIETELLQTKEFLENLIQSSVDAIVAADIHGQIILMNRSAEKLLGYTEQEVVGKIHVDELYAADDAADVMQKLRGNAYGGVGRLEAVRQTLKSKDGDIVPVTMTAAIIYENGIEVATVGIFTDIRERLKMQEKLSVVEQKLQMSERQAVAAELAGAAAHELNQPLTSIMGYAEMLKRRIPEGDRKYKSISVICRETDRMAEIIKKIGHITKYETTDYVGDSQIIDLKGET